MTMKLVVEKERMLIVPKNSIFCCKFGHCRGAYDDICIKWHQRGQKPEKKRRKRRRKEKALPK
jgi:hypothetical protein